MGKFVLMGAVGSALLITSPLDPLISVLIILSAAITLAGVRNRAAPSP